MHDRSGSDVNESMCIITLPVLFIFMVLQRGSSNPNGGGSTIDNAVGRPWPHGSPLIPHYSSPFCKIINKP